MPRPRATQRGRSARWLLLGLLLLQLALLGSQAPSPGEPSRLETALVRTVAPLARAVGSTADSVLSLGEALRLHRSLRAENRRLRSQVEELRRRRTETMGLELELERLSEALDYRAAPRGELLVADVVYIDHVSWLQTLIVYTGDAAVARNQAVVATGGLVGRVVVPTPPYAKVQLITDRNAAVLGMIARTRRQGVVKGADPGSLEMAFVPLQAEVRVGDQVVSAGADGIFPRGVPIGTVTAVKPGDELFHEIRLAPAVDFGVLDQVYVLDREPVPEAAKEARPDGQP